MKHKFITIGEIMLRLTPPDYEKIRTATTFEARYGGSEANVALSLANLGIDASFFTVVPDNSLGKSAVRMMRSNECDKEVTHYLSDKVRQIEQIQDCVKKRNNNLLMLAQYLVNYQQEFFQKGKGHLKPLTMQDVADEFGVHESTISRTVKEKYLQFIIT